MPRFLEIFDFLFQRVSAVGIVIPNVADGFPTLARAGEVAHSCMAEADLLPHTQSVSQRGDATSEPGVDAGGLSITFGVEVAVSENILDAVIEAIIAAARTEKIGDGKIFVYDVESIYRIRTGETDQDAL